MKNASLLIVDDDQTFNELTCDILKFEGFNVLSALNGQSALEILKSHLPDLILLDLSLPDISGIAVLKQVLLDNPGQAVVMVSGQGSIKKAVEAIQLGAHDFVEKPLDAQRLLITVRNTLETNFLKKRCETELQQNFQKYNMVGNSEAMNRTFSLIDALAPTNTSILITGESGTGKEMVARAIHKLSKRAKAPFIHVNCAAIPDSLIESELFGHEKGAFTDARACHKGFFQRAHSGTLFLDEIGDLSLNTQAKILLALETGRIIPIGGEKDEKVDIRIICATNKDIEIAVKKGDFREDLYYRINVVPIHLAPLSQRIDDIVPLANHFLHDYSNKNNIPLKELLPDAQSILKSLPWKGNIRELRNFIEKLVILSDSQRITARIVQNILSFPEINTESSSRETLREAREAFERSYIKIALEEQDWNISKTAETLGIERSHLYRKMEHLRIKTQRD